MAHCSHSELLIEVWFKNEHSEWMSQNRSSVHKALLHLFIHLLLNTFVFPVSDKLVKTIGMYYYCLHRSVLFFSFGAQRRFWLAWMKQNIHIGTNSVDILSSLPLWDGLIKKQAFLFPNHFWPHLSWLGRSFVSDPSILYNV